MRNLKKKNNNKEKLFDNNIQSKNEDFINKGMTTGPECL